MKIEKPAADMATLVLMSLTLEYIKQGHTFSDSLLAFLKWCHKELYENV